MKIGTAHELMKPKIDHIKSLFEEIRTLLDSNKFKGLSMVELSKKLRLDYCDDFELIIIDSDLLENEELTNLNVFLGIDNDNDIVVNSEEHGLSSFDDLTTDMPLWKFDSVQSDIEEILETIAKI